MNNRFYWGIESIFYKFLNEKKNIAASLQRLSLVGEERSMLHDVIYGHHFNGQLWWLSRKYFPPCISKKKKKKKIIFQNNFWVSYQSLGESSYRIIKSKIRSVWRMASDSEQRSTVTTQRAPSFTSVNQPEFSAMRPPIRRATDRFMALVTKTKQHSRFEADEKWRRGEGEGEGRRKVPDRRL